MAEAWKKKHQDVYKYMLKSLGFANYPFTPPFPNHSSCLYVCAYSERY